MHREKVYIVAAQRTPIGRFMGSLSHLKAVELAAFPIKACLHQVKLKPENVDELLVGQVLQAGCGQAPARQIARNAELPDHIPTTSINKVCSSGLKAVTLAAQSIALNENETVIAAGVESMSNTPHLNFIRHGKKLGHLNLQDSLLVDGLTNVYDQKHMGNCAELCAATHQIDRNAQDEYATLSYKRALEAQKNKKFEKEICAVPSFRSKTNASFDIREDEEPGMVKFEKIPHLKPVFDPNGTVTAANASGINDGAAAILLMSESKMKKENLSPMAKIIDWADAAQSPELFTTSPSLAIEKLLKKNGLKTDDIGVFEVNEAFAVVSLANMKISQLPIEKTNIFGGAVALGHPLGCSGNRILVTLCHALQDQNARYGIAAICNGGGGATAVLIENITY